jgi:7-cyano-7-deazaguanine synthase in queuosine biosynthesis
MYSGGLDSTLQAALMASKFERVILMTCHFPWTVGTANSKKNVAVLNNQFPDCQIEHRVVRCGGTRRRVWKGFFEDYFNYCNKRSPSILCLGCELVMLVEAIKLCLTEGAGNITNGISSSQGDHTACKPSMITRFSRFIREYNITYVNDIYYMKTRKEEEELLASLGVSVGVKVGASNITHQPRCLFGPYTTLWSISRPVKLQDMERYFDDRLPLLRQILKPFEEKKGLLHGKEKYAFKARDNFVHQHTHEFSPIIDKRISVGLSPLWLASRYMFKLGKLISKYKR